MSATNRGSIRKEFDFYSTPVKVVKNFLNNYSFRERERERVLEPCSGNGSISKVLKNYYPNLQLDQVEIRQEEKDDLQLYGNVYIEDFLKWQPEHRYSTIITNPPYSLAKEFVEKSLTIADEVIMLLRLAFLESKGRYDFWQKYPLSELYVLSQRPSFTGKGTDATAYAWFVWNKSKTQKIKVI